MAAIDRPTWCQDPSCECLTSYNQRMCVGRLPEKIPHDPDGRDPNGEEELFNTHNFCLDKDTKLAINDADAYFFTRCMEAVRADIEALKLYVPPGRGVIWDLKAR